MFTTVKIKGISYETVGNVAFEEEGSKEVAYVIMYDEKQNVYVAKYNAKDGEIVGNLNKPIDIEMVASAEE